MSSPRSLGSRREASSPRHGSGDTCTPTPKASAMSRRSFAKADAWGTGMPWVGARPRFFSLESRDGRKVHVATWSWDCGRWGWLGHLGQGIGWLSQSLDHRVPTLAIHPRDLERGFWPSILRLTQKLLETGYEPSTPAGLLERSKRPRDRSEPAERRARARAGESERRSPRVMLKSILDAVMERRAGHLIE